VLKTCRTLVWNGPMGAFEIEPFDAATVALARTAAALTKEGSLVSVAGGGDTVAALNHAGVAGTISLSFRPQAAPSSNGWKARNCRRVAAAGAVAIRNYRNRFAVGGCGFRHRWLWAAKTYVCTDRELP
jgi:hypothetical protein